MCEPFPLPVIVSVPIICIFLRVEVRIKMGDHSNYSILIKTVLLNTGKYRAFKLQFVSSETQNCARWEAEQLQSEALLLTKA